VAKNLSLRDNYIALARKHAEYLKLTTAGSTVGDNSNTITTEAELLLLQAATNLIDCVDSPDADTATAIADEAVALKEFKLALSIQG